MTARVTELWRYPIKSHGREALDSVSLTAGQTVPWDRAWAVAHEKSLADGSEWARCNNFTRAAGAPALMAITAELDTQTETVTLRHPNRPDLTFCPDRDGNAFVEWVLPLMPENRAKPVRIVRAQKQGLTDSDFPSVTLCNMSSHRAVEQRIGHPLSIHRWRGNVWLDGLAPWEEFEWMDREIQIGEVVFKVIERTDRCTATLANPVTGLRDANVLDALESWGHQDFSVRAKVVRSGHIHLGDEVIRP